MSGSPIGKAALVLAFVVSILLPIYQLSFPPEGDIKAERGIEQSPDLGSYGSGSVERAPEGALQSMELNRTMVLSYSEYVVEKGDTIGDIAKKFGLNQDTLLSVNNIKNSRLIQIGQKLSIPNQDGILYTVKSGDSLAAVSEKYSVDSEIVKTINGLADDTILTGNKLFLPGARMSQIDVQEINGDLFSWPVRGYISSGYGYRISPFTGARQFHSGLDIAAPQGTPVKAAMYGRVVDTGYDTNSGNYIIIAHHGGYKTLYAHLDVIRVKPGTAVKTGDRIGDVGSTGLSTGSHLHFSVYKYGVTVNPRLLMR
ncbi:peptidoglycan DD-metalloendopeptidase family protein [Gracilinema caldarium]|uniref:Peptidase M23 n=1 Tax=Gracilinema caldarium (strain ATCC 51460 / DSM 7334 / H1) TaxID=744872 RepID=F8EWX8_GRAC1|nr:M23 family metallopeptidase [Gracilinema caldarium]AEJ18505.1 Peptidase M23 [Gracilinema caldarium DSM 7334]